MNRTISEKRNIDVNMFEGGPNSGTVWSKLIPTTLFDAHDLSQLVSQYSNCSNVNNGGQDA